MINPEGLVDLFATDFMSVVFRILYYGIQCIFVVQRPENHRNKSGGVLTHVSKSRPL